MRPVFAFFMGTVFGAFVMRRARRWENPEAHRKRTCPRQARMAAGPGTEQATTSDMPRASN
jgi:hypothetical protein